MSFGYQILGFGSFPSRDVSFIPPAAVFSDGYFNKEDYSSSGSSDKVLTCGGWFKVNDTEDSQTALFCWTRNNNSNDYVRLGHYYQTGQIRMVLQNTSDTGRLDWYTTSRMRDPTAWFHVVWTVSTDGEAVNKLWINGAEVTDFTKTTDSLADGDQFRFGNAAHHHSNFADPNGTSNNKSIYATQMFYQDGQKVTDITNYGEYDTNGVWVPIDISKKGLTFGTNGYLLDFADASNIGNDVSGNNNDMTVNSMGADNIVVDGPANSTTKEITFYPSPEESRKNSNITLSNHNLTVDSGSATGYSVPLNIPLSSGRWQITATVDAIDTSNGGPGLGFAYTANYSNATNVASDPSNFFGMRIRGGPEIQCNNNSTSWNPDNSTTLSTSHTLTLLIDIGAGKAWALQNGTVLQNSSQDSVGNPAVGTQTNPTFTFTADSHITLFMMATSSATITLNPTTVNGSYSGYSAITSTVTGVGNYCTQSPVFQGDYTSDVTLSNGNLTVSVNHDGSNAAHSLGTFALSSGKWYFEVSPTTLAGTHELYFGLMDASHNIQSSNTGSTVFRVIRTVDGNKATTGNGGGTISTYGAGIDVGDTAKVAIDIDAGDIWFGKNTGDTWADGSGSFDQAFGSATAAHTDLDSAANAWLPVYFAVNNGSTNVADVNYGQKPFKFTPPTDYKALNTANLAAPTVTAPSDYFKTILYEGTGAELSTGDTGVAALDFQPDFVWIKNRDASDSHMLYDSVRGATKDMHSEVADAETTTAQTLKSFDANGFTLGTDVQVNTLNESYVAWCWKAGGEPTASNNNTSSAMDANSVIVEGVLQSSYTPSGSPSIYPSKMSINTTAGFSIVSYTGNSTADATVPHGLSSTPEIVIVKNREASESWAVWHEDLSSAKRLDLNLAAGEFSTSNYVKGVTSDVFQFSSSGAVINNGDDFIAYCWHSVEGFSKIGSYVGNGDNIGPFVYTGFLPAFVMLKALTGSQNWRIHDSARNGYNASVEGLFPNTNGTEDTEDVMDMISNGFKLRSNNANCNGDDVTFIYIAFAEKPFGGYGSQTRAR